MRILFRHASERPLWHDNAVPAPAYKPGLALDQQPTLDPFLNEGVSGGVGEDAVQLPFCCQDLGASVQLVRGDVVAGVDGHQQLCEKLVGLDAHGKPNSVDIVGMVPVLVKAAQDQQREILALRAELASALTGTMGGATQTGVTVTSNAATMAAAASSVISVRATTGITTGVKKLVRDPNHTLATGEVFWDGNTGLKFAAIDAVTACDLIYSKSDLSQNVSCLMAAAADIV